MQAIETKFIGATNYRGSRVKAKCEAGSLTLYWDHALNVEQNHDRAAEALIRKLDWHGLWARGAAPNGRGNVYVSLDRYCENGTRRATDSTMLIAPKDAAHFDFAVEAGRGITKNGERYITIARDSASPVEADALTHRIADLLNERGE